MNGNRGWPARYPIAQPPNPPLILAAGGWLVALLAHGRLEAYGRGVSYAALAAWAWLEVTEGANAFRRALGAVVFALVVVRVADAFDA
ncbi:MAG: hypothetical protein ACJ762_01680 [Solirubrobacteraceae bacterium]